MAQMKEQIKAPEIIQLSSEQIANLSNAQFKTLVIRMLTELVQFGCTLDEKNEERLSNLWDNLKHSNIQIIGVPEGEEQWQEIENLFEQIMKENFPNLAKEIDFQEVQEAQRVPKKLYPRKHTPKHITIKLPKIKDKERILKAARERELPTKEFP